MQDLTPTPQARFLRGRRHGDVTLLPDSVKSNNDPYPDSVEFRLSRLGEVNHSLLVRVTNVDLHYEHAKKCRTLSALMLAHNLFCDSFFEARCGLGGKTTGHFL